MSKWYKPKLAKLVASELALVSEYDEGIAYFLPDDANLMTRYEVETPVNNTMVTYNFSSAVRNNSFPVARITGSTFRELKKATYGRGGFSFRLLYEMLCKYYNDGEYFIDTYIQSVFPRRAVYREFRSIHKGITRSIAMEVDQALGETRFKADGTPDYRYRGGKKLRDFAVWKSDVVKQKSLDIASKIRDDIIVCLSTGKIPLKKRKIPLKKQRVSEATEKKRSRFPSLDKKHFFFASGQLIRALRIFVDLSDGGGNTWQDYR
jgi:hypothetical protein